MILAGKTEGLGQKTCARPTAFIKNPAWTDSGKNPVLRGEKPATNACVMARPAASYKPVENIVCRLTH